MGIEDLSDLEIVYGLCNLIYICFTVIITMKILLKYRILKRKEFITVGLTFFFLNSAYWSITINFILIILFNTLLPIPVSIFIERAFIPAGLVCWMSSFAKLAYPKFERELNIFSLIFCIPYEIFLIIFIIINPDIIAIQTDTFYTQHGSIPLAFNFFTILIVIITVSLFARISFRSDKRIVRLQGKLVLIGILLICGVMVLDTVVPLNMLTAVLTRLIFFIGTILFYFGLFYPGKSTD